MAAEGLFSFAILCFASYCASAQEAVNLGDIPIENPDLFGGDILGVDDHEDRNAVVDSRQIWPGGIVPYVRDPGLKETVFDFIMRGAFDEYKKKTCIRFIPRTTEKDYIRIFPGQGCYSHVGKTGNQQPVSLGQGCGWTGTVIHELGHAIGFYHEQNRSDRDDWLIIYWENVKEGMADQFFKLKPNQNQLLTPFDYDSVMLYGSYTFSKDRKNLKTMVGKDGRFLQEVTFKKGLSPSDVIRIKKLYKCQD
ncbi:astacin-like metalloprotease toxin 5 [Stegodyphus dumicola]|uniref:astacin-like metalloprotease toxin 5 n=1 Tax=Stegodyphus dumicola TaxID=202533 RepID=UPI0015AB2C57|nr:astacin-like metalloprotease toxin 5 [Stegodyphus dumicola]